MAAPTNTVMKGSDVYLLALRIARDIAPRWKVNAHDLARIMTALTLKESTWNPNAKNKKSTARGLAQILLGTQKEIETKLLGIPHQPEKIYDPAYAMLLGSTYLAYHFNRKGYGTWDKAIHAYNQGSVPGVHPKDGTAYRQHVQRLVRDLAADFAGWDRALELMKTIPFAQTVITMHYDPPLSLPVTYA